MADQKKAGTQIARRAPPTSVAKTPSDLPSQRVVSGTGSGAVVQLTPQEAKYIVLVERGPTVFIVADASLHGGADSTALFQALRSRLPAQRYKESPVLWATSALIEQLNQLRLDVGDKSTSLLEAGNSEAAAYLHQWVDYSLVERASDIHLEVRRSGAGVRFRIDGDLERMRGEGQGAYIPALAQATAAYVYNKMTDTGSTSSSQFQVNKHSYAMVTLGEGETALKLRCQMIALVNGFDLVMRLLPTTSVHLSYEQLGYLPEQARMLVDATVVLRGLLLIAGVTGSGKTTTVRTVLQSIPGRERLKLATIEDPVEYMIEGVSHTALQRDVSNDAESAKVFNEAVKSWMRGDPDVMSVGEIRDFPSGVAALTEAETGHMAIGTVHANTAAGILQRLVSPAVGLDLHALTSPDIVQLLVYQALVPILCDKCKIPIEDMPGDVQHRYKKHAKKFNVDIFGMCFKREDGCAACRHRGTKGMQVVAEMIRPDRTFLSLMRERREFDAIDHWLATGDLQYDTPNMTGKTVFHHAFYLALQGQIDPSVPERFERYDQVELVADRLERNHSVKDGHADRTRRS